MTRIYRHGGAVCSNTELARRLLDDAEFYKREKRDVYQYLVDKAKEVLKG